MRAPCLIAFAICTACGTPFEQRSLTPEQRITTDRFYDVAVTPGDIRLRIVPEAEWQNDRPDINALAYSRPTGTPCRIIIPAGWIIRMNPAIEDARWADSADGDILAHEILHCLIPDWHSDYTMKRGQR